MIYYKHGSKRHVTTRLRHATLQLPDHHALSGFPPPPRVSQRGQRGSRRHSFKGKGNSQKYSGRFLSLSCVSMYKGKWEGGASHSWIGTCPPSPYSPWVLTFDYSPTDQDGGCIPWLQWQYYGCYLRRLDPDVCQWLDSAG